MWCVKECDVSLTITDVHHGAAYQGVSTMVCALSEGTQLEAASPQDNPTQASEVAALFHACPRRIAIHRIVATSGKRQIKVSKFVHHSSGDVTVNIDADSLGHCVVWELQVSFASSFAVEGVRTGIYCCRMPSGGGGGGGGGAKKPAVRGGAVTSGGPNAIFSHFEVTHAREAFPCPDHPSMRLNRWRLQLALPRAMTTAISNTLLWEPSKDNTGPGGSLRTFVFSKTSGDVPLPAYVLGFAAFCDGIMQCTEAIADEAPVAGVEASHVAVRVWSPCASTFPVPFLVRATKSAILYLSSFFGTPLPCEGSKLDIVVVPSMDLGGMEHHGCIFINESLCGACSVVGASSTGKKPSSSGSSSSAKVEEIVAQMIVHELAHHWVGNAIGLPFELKEGVCMILEQAVGDVVLGRPMRKFTDTTGPTCASAAKEGVSSDDALRGRELTGRTYQDAARKMTTLVADLGWGVFEASMQRLVSAHFGEYVPVPVFESFLGGGA